MATLAVRPQLGAASQHVSSPLAGPAHHPATAPPRSPPCRTPHFPTSRPLRPFASMSQALSRTPVKLIEPPQNFKTTFILDLTQGELSRQD